MKPPKLTPSMFAHDCLSLQRILRRLTSDDTRSEAQRQELGGHLLIVITAYQKEMVRPVLSEDISLGHEDE